MSAAERSNAVKAPIRVMGLPITPYTTIETVDRLDEIVKSRNPAYIGTANLNYAMLCDTDSASIRPSRLRSSDR